MQVPAGSLPRTTDVILRHDIVESARAGDKVVFTGNVIVVPDVAAISTPGERVEASMSRLQTLNHSAYPQRLKADLYSQASCQRSLLPD